MNLEQARAYAQRHEDVYNNDFEHYHDLYAEDFSAYRPVNGVIHDRAAMYALEQRATAACPDRKTKVIRVFAGDDDWFGIEELWQGTNTGGDERFGPLGAKLSVHAFSMYQVRDGKFVRAIAWTGRPPAEGVG
ncbi:MAG: nuclear transport factor 2 family protein [Dehalococcoidia bacterium]